jgi:multidrug efflux pump subunit AcrB
MEAFFRYFAKRDLLAYLITFLIVALGIGSLLTIKRDSFPDVEFGEVLVTTRYPGAAPEDVELKVTNKIEKELKTVTGIKRFQSWSMENVSLIHILIDPDERSEEKTVREIREAVSRVTDLPPEVEESPLVTELSTKSFPMVEIGLTGDLPYPQLRELARRFEKKLENVSGVSSVKRYGYRAREIRVEVNPKALKKYEVSLNDIIRAIKKRNVRVSGGNFESYTSEKNIVTLAQFRDPMEVGDVIVKTTFNGPLIRVKDLAIVRDDFEDEKVASRINGVSAISFVAYKTSSADIIRTVDNIRDLIKREQALLPDHVRLVISDDKSKYVRNRLDIVVNNGLIGLTLVLLVLTLFLNLRVAFWVAVGIPVSVLGVIFLLPIFHTYLDSVALTSMVLVLGIIVDDAIIISENIYQLHESGLPPLEAAVKGVTGVFRPVITTILTTFAAFAPLFFMPGMLGKFVYVIPLVISLALFISLLESSLALPAHLKSGMRNMRADTTHAAKRFFNWARATFSVWLNCALRFRYGVLLLFVAILAAALFYAVRYLDFVLFPSTSADRFLILIQTPSGSSLQATSDRVKQVEKIVEAMDKHELDSFMTRIGTYGEIGSSEREDNAAIVVSLTPYNQRNRSADQIIAELRSKMDKIPGIKRLHFMIDAGGPPVGRPILIRAVGPDDHMRKKLADAVEAFVTKLPGTKDIDRDDRAGKQQVELKFKYARLAQVGITVADIAQYVRIAYDGEVVTSVRYGDEDVDFRVIFNKSIRKDPSKLGEFVIRNAGGHLTPLKKLIYTVPSPGPSTIHHYKGDRAITISGDIDKKVTSPLKISQAVLKHFNVDRDYPGIQLAIGGEAEESAKSLNDLLIILAIAALAIYFLLILLFNSVWQPFMVMAAIPFGIVGVIIGFSIHHEPLGFLAMTGIIGLAGVVVNDSLVLVNHVNELREHYPDKTIMELVKTGAVERLRPILLTTISTVVGLMPLAYGLGGVDPYMSPMALALAWGLLFATLLTLFLVPCLYLIGDDIVKMFKKPQV